MDNKEKYEGKTVMIFSPTGRQLGRLQVEEVLGNNVLCGVIPESQIETAYYLSDGITVVCEP